MRRSLIIIGLIIALSSVAFGQKNKKTNQNPSTATAGAEQQQTAAKQQATTQKAQSEADFNRWYSAKAYNWDAVKKLNNSSQYVDDNTFRLTKQYASQALGKLLCHVNKVNPCNSSGEVEGSHPGDMYEVRSDLTDAKNALQKVAGTAEKDEVMSLLNRAIELANTYIQAHPPETQTKDKESSSNKTTPPIDESTKTQKGQNPIANGTTNSTTSNSTQKTTSPNSGFMDYTDDAVKSAPKNAKKTNNLGGDDDLEKTQRSTKANKPNSKTQKTTTTQDAGYRDTDEDVEDVKSNNSKTKPQANRVYEEDEQKTQRSTKNTNSKAKTTAPNKQIDTNFQTTSEDLQSVKSAKTQNGVNDPGDWSSKTKRKTTPKSTKTSQKAKPQTNGVYEEDEQKTQRSTKNTNAKVQNPKTKTKKTTTQTPANTTPKNP